MRHRDIPPTSRDDTDRRRFLASLSGAAIVGWAAGAKAQSGKTYRLGIMINAHNEDADEFLRGLRDHGYIEGQNLIVEWRFSDGKAGRWLGLAQELAALKPDVVYVQTTPAALAMKQVAPSIPTIIPTAIDPVGSGLAASLAWPGGNVTGLATLQPEISAKALSLLKAAAPSLRRVAVLWDAGNPAFARVWDDIAEAARSAGFDLLSQPVRQLADFTPALVAIAAQHTDGLLVLGDALTGQALHKIAEFSMRERLPAASTFREFTALGGLLSYAPDYNAANREGAADYAVRVLKGESPAELPFQQPTKFELVINLKTAKMLGLTLPPLLLARADEVIE